MEEDLEKHDYTSDLWEAEARYRSARRFNLILQVYAVIGVLIGVVGSLVFLSEQFEIQINIMERMALTIAGIGFSLSLLSVALLYLRKQRQSEEFERSFYLIAASEFLAQWARFEDMARAKLDSTGVDFNRFSLRDILSGLIRQGELSPNDAAFLEEAVRLRNLLVHGGRQLPTEHLQRMTRTIAEITGRLDHGQKSSQ